MLKDLKKVKDKVLHCLEISERARDDDTYLFLLYLYKFHNSKSVIESGDLKKFNNWMLNDVPKIESIRRSRAKIQETGLYQGKQRRGRLKEAEKVKEYLNK